MPMISGLKIRTLLVIITLSFFSCSSYDPVTKKTQSDNNERFVLATLWMELSAEYKALQFQAYNLARYKIEQYISHNKLNGNEAVVLDIDETVLETSLYQAEIILNGNTWPEGWDRFLEKEDCRPVAGSLEFLNFADSLGIKIFYVSNRTEAQKTSLINNLKKFKLPQAEKENIFLKTNNSSKEERRNIISSENNILLLIGDNLGDFSDLLNKGNSSERINSVYEMRDYFGDKFIILPNPAYGDWEGALNPNYWKMNAAQRDSLRKDALLKIL
jgi:5'-nucleotidase (lipoprotein e(P4) family)